LETNFDLSPPSPPTLVATGFADDDIRDLGDRIANLTLLEARDLANYIEEIHGISLK
jgi:hypothetical protein